MENRAPCISVWLRRKQDELQGQHDRLKRELIQRSRRLLTKSARSQNQIRASSNAQTDPNARVPVVKTKEEQRGGRLLTLPRSSRTSRSLFPRTKRISRRPLARQDPRGDQNPQRESENPDTAVC